jgi:hypothetical protein
MNDIFDNSDRTETVVQPHPKNRNPTLSKIFDISMCKRDERSEAMILERFSGMSHRISEGDHTNA